MVRVFDETSLDKNKLNIDDITSKISDERGPYQNVFLQKFEVKGVPRLIVIKADATVVVG